MADLVASVSDMVMFFGDSNAVVVDFGFLVAFQMVSVVCLAVSGELQAEVSFRGRR